MLDFLFLKKSVASRRFWAKHSTTRESRPRKTVQWSPCIMKQQNPYIIHRRCHSSTHYNMNTHKLSISTHRPQPVFTRGKKFSFQRLSLKGETATAEFVLFIDKDLKPKLQQRARLIRRINHTKVQWSMREAQKFYKN